MNDLERDLRELLDEDARRVSTPVAAPEGLRRSARRRQVLFAGAVGLATVAIVAGVVAGASLLLPLQNDGQPAVEGPKTTGTLNGITITYPQAWHLIDPDTAALNGSPMMGESPLPRIVLSLAPTQAPETFGCPGRVGGDAASTSLMTVQEEAPAVTGPASDPWPVELGTMDVDASESGCYPGWTFERAVWTAAGRTFDARIGFSPAASDEEHDAMVTAFASMTFEAPSQAPYSGTVTSGTAGGTEWSLIAGRDDVGLTLALDVGTSGSGTSFYNSPKALHPVGQPLGTGSDREVVAYGAVPVGVTRVEATAADGSV